MPGGRIRGCCFRRGLWGTGFAAVERGDEGLKKMRLMFEALTAGQK
jgi:hypothetical protein